MPQRPTLDPGLALPASRSGGRCVVLACTPWRWPLSRVAEGRGGALCAAPLTLAGQWKGGHTSQPRAHGSDSGGGGGERVGGRGRRASAEWRREEAEREATRVLDRLSRRRRRLRERHLTPGMKETAELQLAEHIVDARMREVARYEAARRTFLRKSEQHLRGVTRRVRDGRRGTCAWVRARSLTDRGPRQRMARARRSASRQERRAAFSKEVAHVRVRQREKSSPRGARAHPGFPLAPQRRLGRSAALQGGPGTAEGASQATGVGGSTGRCRGGAKSRSQPAPGPVRRVAPVGGNSRSRRGVDPSISCATPPDQLPSPCASCRLVPEGHPSLPLPGCCLPIDSPARHAHNAARQGVHRGREEGGRRCPAPCHDEVRESGAALGSEEYPTLRSRPHRRLPSPAQTRAPASCRRSAVPPARVSRAPAAAFRCSVCAAAPPALPVPGVPSRGGDPRRRLVWR